ncbi:collagen-like protein [Agromyces sp. MMS24-JH15]|uniref:collagen-like triple helix repeat-containing protein n=1 Tax=Agromyces sp. MMS24-JH15 TaxID=3243765 RepID=UPI003748F7BB
MHIRRHSRARKVAVAAAAASLVVLSLGGAAVAAASSAPPTIVSCVSKLTGDVRLIEPSLGSRHPLGTCTKVERQVSWNAEGVPGPAGPAGEVGAPGPTGQTGAPGSVGADGQSVTVQHEPAGANCEYGGTKFTAVNGDSFACNGNPGSVASSPVYARTLNNNQVSILVPTDTAGFIEIVRAGTGLYCLSAADESRIDGRTPIASVEFAGTPNAGATSVVVETPSVLCGGGPTVTVLTYRYDAQFGVWNAANDVSFTVMVP